MIRWLFFLNMYLWVMIKGNYYLYKTQGVTEDTALEFDCLEVTYRREHIESLTIEFCLRPSNGSEDEWYQGFALPVHKSFTFEELSAMNKTSSDLLLWSSSMDLVEQYQEYLDSQNKTLESKTIRRCRNGWFGPQCQYSFGRTGTNSIISIVNDVVLEKMKQASQHIEVFSTCFVHLPCKSDGIPVCLYWYQICDGKIDCSDGLEDEMSCFPLEINECKDDEYRCHNGLCIDKKFVGGKNDLVHECLDRSDILVDPEIFLLHDIVPRVLWREYGCGTDEEIFSMAGFQCTKNSPIYVNGQNNYFAPLLNAQGLLSIDCWMVMTCLTRIFNQVNGTSCKNFLALIDVHQSTMTCPDSIFRFPTRFVLLGHIRFFYSRDKLLMRWNSSEALAPDYVCYNSKLCPHLQSNLLDDNLTCVNMTDLGLYPYVSYSTWKSLVDAIKEKFLGCLIHLSQINETKSSSLYCCRNSLKCISKHRIVDGIVDCPYSDDEQAYELSCSIKNQFRFKCMNESQCRLPFFIMEPCPEPSTRGLDHIPFQDICDRILQTTPQLIDGKYYTDETECEHWSCNNIYTRCDHFWNCPLGEDEHNCTDDELFGCPIQTLVCVSVLNHTIICLPATKVFDGIIDCLGGGDEETICRQNQTFDETYHGFLCAHSSKCIPSVSICDGEQDCPLNDDEQFCDSHSQSCDTYLSSSVPDTSNLIERALCRVVKWRRSYFSFEILPIYPPALPSNKIAAQSRSSKSKATSNILIDTRMNDHSQLWRCHFGLSALIQISSNRTMHQCFCPPNFYGDLCQYQSERVSVSLKVSSIGRGLVRGFIISLLTDDNDREEVHSYHQDVYVLDDTCGKTFQFFLLYSTRPKNASLQYGVRIEVFDKISLQYLATWYFPIPFLFLPVYPMAVSIYLPTEPLSLPRHCSLGCIHGRCKKYVNSDKLFCHCHRGWNGARCQYPIPCDRCSVNSTCSGAIRNHPICACPINTFGRYCLLKYDCPDDVCENGGQCLITDRNQHYEGYACMCKKEYFGAACNLQKKQLQITFQDVPVPSFVKIYMYYDNGLSFGKVRRPSLTFFATKLKMFQTSVSFLTEASLKLVIAQRNNEQYFLAIVRKSSNVPNISTTITPAQECPHVNQLMDSYLTELPLIRRVKYYHRICRIHSKLMCFIDEMYLCLCTTDRHADCLHFQRNFNCEDSTFCLNQGECLQNQETCPTVTFCICSDCFFGDRCQYYAKGVGLVLDDMLRYEIRPYLSLNDQPISVKVSAALVVIMFCAGLINSVLSIMTFRRPASRRVGAGIYLLTSSITSLCTVSMLNVKFWFLIITQMHTKHVSIDILRGGCFVIEPLLKFCLYFDSWLNACVAVERAMTVSKGNNFDKNRSKKAAIVIIILMPILVGGSMIHEALYRELFEDKDEQRYWCSLRYSSSIVTYTSFILAFHIVVPFAANFLSAIYIIWHSVRRRARMNTRQTYRTHVLKQLKEYRHLIISPSVLVLLSLPRVIISSLPGCIKEHRNPWLFLVGYFISFIPAITIFLIFVLPSPLYTEEFRNTTRGIRNRIQTRCIRRW